MAAGGLSVAWVMMTLVGALIGWLTNVAAVRLLFRPHRPVRILGVTIQGVLPRRRAELAETIGRVVETELLRRDDLVQGALRPAVREQIAVTISRAAGDAARNRLPTFLPEALRTVLADAVRNAAAAEGRRFAQDRLPDLAADLIEDVDIAGMVRDRLLALDLEQLEELALTVARRQLRHIEWVGAVLGGLVGLAQAALVTALQGAGLR